MHASLWEIIKVGRCYCDWEMDNFVKLYISEKSMIKWRYQYTEWHNHFDNLGKYELYVLLFDSENTVWLSSVVNFIVRYEFEPL